MYVVRCTKNYWNPLFGMCSETEREVYITRKQADDNRNEALKAYPNENWVVLRT